VEDYQQAKPSPIRDVVTLHHTPRHAGLVPVVHVLQSATPLRRGCPA